MIIGKVISWSFQKSPCFYVLSLVHSWELQRELKWENIFWGGHPLALSQGQQKAWKAHISKWTTSGDPPVRSESLSDSYSSSNKLLLSAGYYETPCMYIIDPKIWLSTTTVSTQHSSKSIGIPVISGHCNTNNHHAFSALREDRESRGLSFMTTNK